MLSERPGNADGAPMTDTRWHLGQGEPGGGEMRIAERIRGPGANLAGRLQPGAGLGHAHDRDAAGGRPERVSVPQVQNSPQILLYIRPKTGSELEMKI